LVTAPAVKEETDAFKAAALADEARRNYAWISDEGPGETVRVAPPRELLLPLGCV
jgi:hypothetical protein